MKRQIFDLCARRSSASKSSQLMRPTFSVCCQFLMMTTIHLDKMMFMIKMLFYCYFLFALTVVKDCFYLLVMTSDL